MTFKRYPELLQDKSGKVYLAPNCYCMVDLSTGKTVNRPQYGLERIQKRQVTYVWEQK